MATSHERAGRTRPGAMTLAMRAATQVDDARAKHTANAASRVLRLGLLRHGALLEERIVRERASVTVGSSERCTFTLEGAHDAPSFTLVRADDDGYVLVFTDAMQGRVVVDGAVKSLTDLLREGRAIKARDGYELRLDPQARGKVTLGDATVLFQFVAPPPVAARPQLPASLTGGWARRIDWTYHSCLAAFLVAAFGALAHIEYVYDPVIEDSFALDARVVTLAQPAVAIEPDPPVPVASASVAPSAAPSASTDPTRPERERPREHAAPTADGRTNDALARVDRAVDRATRATVAAERAAEVALSALAQNREVARLVGSLDVGAGNAVDRLQQGGIMQDSLGALENISGLRAPTQANSGLSRAGLVASAGPPIGRRTLGGRMPIDNVDGARIGTGQPAREVAPRGIARMIDEDPVLTGAGELDARTIAGGVRGALSGIRSCYERSIRTNPQLSGRLELRFTIGTSGRVTSASTEGLESAPDAGACISRVVQRIVFPPPSGGSVSTSFSFNFTPGS